MGLKRVNFAVTQAAIQTIRGNRFSLKYSSVSLSFFKMQEKSRKRATMKVFQMTFPAATFL